MIRLLINYINAWRERHNPTSPYVANWQRPWDGRSDIAGLFAAVAERGGTWAAVEPGECCTCGHEWRKGEIIGVVTQAYERLDNGSVRRSPGARLACATCVEAQRRHGDLSLQWAREAGLL